MQLQVIGIWFWSIGYFVLRFTIKFFQIMKLTVIKVSKISKLGIPN